MNDRERARLDALLAQLTSDRHAQDFLRDHYEGIYVGVADYALARLRSELPRHLRWLVAYVDHAAAGEYLAELGLIVVFAAPALADEGDTDAGVVVFRGKG